MNTKLLKQRILDLAIHGRLVPGCNLSQWKTMKLGEVCEITDGDHLPPPKSESGFPFITISNIDKDAYKIKFDNTFFVPETYFKGLKDNRKPKRGDVLYTVTGSYGIPVLVDGEREFCFQRHIGLLRPIKDINSKFLFYWVLNPETKRIADEVATGTAQKTVSLKSLRNFSIPLPPLAEQQRIVSAIEKWFSLIDEIETNKESLQAAIKQTKSKVLDLAIKGRLVKKTAEWKMVKLEDTVKISRGGSPRPIQKYITTAPDGINWIKIGDTKKGSKYINSVEQKITKEGAAKSRFVKKGDFLLSNSMSFGRPYILNIEGCVHDGWLILSPIENVYTKDFLYYLLSSHYAFEQFTNLASGNTVSNLNINKVAQTVFPLPPLSEQTRIVSKIEEVFALLDEIERELA